jgi:type I restriction enzyme R subunit
MIISHGLEAKAGSLSAGLSRFMAWKTADGKEEASHLVSQLETLIKGMLNKENLVGNHQNSRVIPSQHDLSRKEHHRQ